jgi:NADPH:quinone reductase-like Zn-dependent oxidoreductase
MPLAPTHTVNYKTEDFAEIVKDATGGKGVDVLVDFVGKAHWEKNIASLAVDGRMVLLALLSGDTFFIDQNEGRSLTL